jgi:hypothetical protein
VNVNRPIALMTDFGYKDPFVGMMKSVVLGINPSARIIDLCHEIAPGDVRSASFALMVSFRYLPEGTVVVAVIDPGVGTGRDAIAAEIEGHIVVCPDNGLLTWLLTKHHLTKAVSLVNREYFLPEVSSTFHGRDVFAPVAAHLSSGLPIEDLGPAAGDLTTFGAPEAVEAERSVRGEVVYVDQFGNLLTNITPEMCRGLGAEGRLESLRVELGSLEVLGVREAYGEVPRGHIVVVVGSAGVLEIAVNGGNAAHTLQFGIGTPVLVYGSADLR